MNSILRAAVPALLAVFAAAPAFAKDNGDRYDRHEPQQHRYEPQQHRYEPQQHRYEPQQHRHAGDNGRVRPGAYFTDRHREYAHRYYVEQYGNGRHCPPGLAKKHNGCMPPGQARKWRVGEPMPRGVVVYPVPQPVLVQLPPAPMGYRYSRVGADIALVRIQGNLVMDVMINVFN